ncbi:MAG: hypothetical protein ACYTGQ_16665 [Planctomycetota bacterium]|jgi:hypothetical protein
MSAQDPSPYGQAFAELLAAPRRMVLDQGSPNVAAKPALRALTIEHAFAGRNVVDRDMAAACISGMWLYHDYHDKSHTFSQDIHTPTGSFWHGIMHRREPDYWNSKYWFRKVGEHPVLPGLASAAEEEAQVEGLSETIAHLTSGGRWDTAGFVDLCEEAYHEGSGLESLCQAIQWREWWLLFDYSFQNAIGVS